MNGLLLGFFSGIIVILFVASYSAMIPQTLAASYERSDAHPTWLEDLTYVGQGTTVKNSQENEQDTCICKEKTHGTFAAN